MTKVGIKWLRRDCHNLALYFSLCISEKAFKRELKRHGITENTSFLDNWHSGATTHFFESRKNKKQHAIICIHPATDKPIEQVYALLVHEAVHVWQEHCSLIGEKYPSSEFECYSIQSISQELMIAHREMTKPKKKTLKRKARRK